MRVLPLNDINSPGGPRINIMRDKKQKFVEIAERRVNQLLRNIRLIGNLSNRGNYQYSTEDVNKIFSAIDNEMKTAKKRFEIALSSEESGFRLR